MAGYSGTPLPQKLGIKPGHRVALLKAPEGFERTLGSLPKGATTSARVAGKRPYDVILLFLTERSALEKEFGPTVEKLAPERFRCQRQARGKFRTRSPTSGLLWSW